MLPAVYKFREIHRLAIVNVLEFIHTLSEPGLPSHRFLFELHKAAVTVVIYASLSRGLIQDSVTASAHLLIQFFRLIVQT
jgi:hypothetical protein